MACGAFSCTAGLLTLIQYIFILDFGIDQLFMEHHITVGTSHPDRMAPNTAVCFSLTGAALLAISEFRLRRLPLITGILGSIILALGVVAFFGYLMEIESAYGWGN